MPSMGKNYILIEIQVLVHFWVLVDTENPIKELTVVVRPELSTVTGSYQIHQVISWDSPKGTHRKAEVLNLGLRVDGNREHSRLHEQAAQTLTTPLLLHSLLSLVLHLWPHT